MGLFGDIGNFFKNATNEISSTIIKPIGRFVSHTCGREGYISY